MAAKDDIVSIDNQIASLRAQKITFENSAREWTVQSKQSCNYLSPLQVAKRKECAADRLTKQAKGEQAQQSANNCDKQIASLQSQRIIAEQAADTERKLAETLAAQGKTLTSVEIESKTLAQGQADAQKIAAEISAKAQAEAMSKLASVDAQDETNQATVKKIALYVGLGIGTFAVLVTLFILYKKFK